MRACTACTWRRSATLVGCWRRAIRPRPSVAEPARQRRLLFRRQPLPVLAGPPRPRGSGGGPRPLRTAGESGRLLSAVLGHLPVVLRRQLQLRRRRPLLAGLLPAAGVAGQPRRHGCHRVGRPPPSPWHCSGCRRWALEWMFLWQAPRVRAVGEEAWAARADVAFARAFLAELEPDALVLTHNPNMFLIWGANAAQMGFAVDPGLFRRRAATSRCARLPALGILVQRRRPHERRVQFGARANRRGRSSASRANANYRYAFYRVRPKEEAPPQPVNAPDDAAPKQAQ